MNIPGQPAPTRRIAPPSAAAVLSCAWPALLLATACLVPFLNKPFLIDDPAYLLMAGQILRSPRHPMDFTVCWNIGDTCMKQYLLTPGNTLMGYALVPTVLAGAPEWMAHATQLVFVWIAIIAMSSLVLRFGWSKSYAIAGALLLVAIPPFLPLASTAMPDILATALSLVAIERLIAWKSERKLHQGATAAIALGLAGVARPHLTLLLPLAAFCLAEFSLWLPVLAGALILATVILLTRERTLLVDPPPLVTGQQHVISNLRAYFLYFCFPIPLAAAWAVGQVGDLRAECGDPLGAAPGRKPGILVSVAVFAAAVASILLQKYTLILSAIGLCAIAHIAYKSAKNRTHEELFLTLWMLIPLPIVFYYHLPIKYLLPCMPAVILTCFRLTESVRVPPARIATPLLIAGLTLYSLLILRSDAEFAAFGRDSIYSLIRPRVTAGQKVWYGGEFSSYWYAPLAGAELYVVGVSKPKPGDLLAIGVREGGATTLAHFPKRTLVQTLSHKYSFGRTMYEGKGLYTNVAGLFPWGFGDSPDDRYELWRVD